MRKVKYISKRGYLSKLARRVEVNISLFSTMARFHYLYSTEKIVYASRKHYDQTARRYVRQTITCSWGELGVLSCLHGTGCKLIE